MRRRRKKIVRVATELLTSTTLSWFGWVIWVGVCRKIWRKRGNNNIVATYKEDGRLEAKSIGRNKEGQQVMYEETYRVYEIYANDGTPIEVQQTTSYRVFTTDKDGKKVDVDPGVALEIGSNCHGFTFTQGKFWLQPEEAQKLVAHDYEQSSKKDATAVMLKDRKTGYLTHSGKKTGKKSYDHKPGYQEIENAVTLGDVKGYYPGTKANFIKQSGANKVIDTTLGKVDDNGVRKITNKEDIKKFIESLK